MNKILIKHFINKLTIKDVEKYSKSQNINLNQNEIEFIYKTIKHNWYTIIYEDYTPILNELKQNINQSEYQKIHNLFITYKDKYKNYL